MTKDELCFQVVAQMQKLSHAKRYMVMEALFSITGLMDELAATTSAPDSPEVQETKQIIKDCLFDLRISLFPTEGRPLYN